MPSLLTCDFSISCPVSRMKVLKLNLSDAQNMPRFNALNCGELVTLRPLTFGHDATASSRSAQRSDGLVPWRMANIVNPVDT